MCLARERVNALSRGRLVSMRVGRGLAASRRSAFCLVAEFRMLAALVGALGDRIGVLSWQALTGGHLRRAGVRAWPTD